MKSKSMSSLGSWQEIMTVFVTMQRSAVQVEWQLTRQTSMCRVGHEGEVR